MSETESMRKGRWYQRYSREVKNMTTKYEIINACAKTTIRQATPEEMEYYSKLAEKDRLYYKNQKVVNYQW